MAQDQVKSNEGTTFFGEQWFAPSVIAKVLRSLVHKFGPDDICVHVPMDGAVYKDTVEKLCTSARSNNDKCPPQMWRSILILIPLRLGISKINPTYFEPLLETFKFPQSVGIIGGRPRQAYYIIAHQDQELIFLDPHMVQQAVKPEQSFSSETYHCAIPQKIAVSELDPSLAVGFYCKDKQDFDDFYLRAEMHSLNTHQHKRI